jgi:hypothetical protein
MKRLISLWLAALMLAAQPIQAAVTVGFGQGSSSTLACIGYHNDQTDCNFSTATTTIARTSSYTFARKWTPSVSGSVNRIKFYFGDVLGTYSNIKAAVWKNDKLVATATITPSINSWVWSGTLVAESGQSLNFSSGDFLVYGVTVENPTGLSMSRTYDEAITNYMYANSYLPASITASVGGYQIGTILEYYAK